MSEAIVRSELGALVKVADALGDAGPMLPKHITTKGAALAVIMVLVIMGTSRLQTFLLRED